MKAEASSKVTSVGRRTSGWIFANSSGGWVTPCGSAVASCPCGKRKW